MTGRRTPSPGRGPLRGTHECPAVGCDLRVRADMLMCRGHWRQVPKPLRDAVWAAWADGFGAGSPSHQAAVRDAVNAINRKLAGAS